MYCVATIKTSYNKSFDGQKQAIFIKQLNLNIKSLKKQHYLLLEIKYVNWKKYRSTIFKEFIWPMLFLQICQECMCVL